MSYDHSSGFRNWDIDEVVIRGRGALTAVLGRLGRQGRGVADKDLYNVFSELRLLRAAGCPPDRTRGNPNLQPWKKHKPPGVSQGIMVYVLKAQPGRYRIYFYVDDPAQQKIIILYVVEKKRQERNPADFERCCNVLDKLARGEAEVQPVEIPGR